MSEHDQTEKLPVIQPRKEYLAWNIVLTLAALFLNALVVYVAFHANRFSAISTDLFYKLNLILFIVAVALDVLTYLGIRRRSFGLKVTSTILACAIAGAGFYGINVLNRLNDSLNKLTTNEYAENVNAAFVVTQEKSALFSSVSDLDGQKVGYVPGTKIAQVGQKAMTNAGADCQWEEYDNDVLLIKALSDGQVDCALLPSAYSDLYAGEEGLSEILGNLVTFESMKDTVTSSQVAGTDKDLTKEPFTILVTGENEGLADTIIVASVNPVSMKVTMTSIPRDSYVPVACTYGSSKINAAHAYGEECMVNTVENLLGVNIDYTVEFDFISVIKVVDAVGGVTVDIPVDFDAQCWDPVYDELVVIPLKAGENVHLNGQETLGFVRERHAFLEGDFAREENQRNVIMQILGKIMETRNPETLVNIVEAAGDHMKTNVDINALMKFFSYAMRKANRYYDSSSPVDVFHIVSSRVYGYNSSIYDGGLNMSLYIYRLFNGSIADIRDAIERNLNLYATPVGFEDVSWTSAEEYIEPPMSAEWYYEPQIAGETEPIPVPEQPTEPQTVEPEVPSDQPVTPSEPETPTEPEQPTEPENPTEPTTPTEPTEPEQPTEPTEPTTPTEPDPGGETQEP